MLFETSNRYEAKRLLYTGKEQRREAKEAYEEKCERKVLGIQRNKPRWCPELTQYDFKIFFLESLALVYN